MSLVSVVGAIAAMMITMIWHVEIVMIEAKVLLTSLWLLGITMIQLKRATRAEYLHGTALGSLVGVTIGLWWAYYT